MAPEAEQQRRQCHKIDTHQAAPAGLRTALAGRNSLGVAGLVKTSLGTVNPTLDAPGVRIGKAWKALATRLVRRTKYA